MHIVRDTLLEAQGRGARIEHRVAVIGIGQRLRGDDAAGIEAVQAWMSAYPRTAGRPEVQAEMLEAPGLGLLEALEDVETAIIVDAFQAGEAPGAVMQLGQNDLDAFDSSAKSAHGWGVAETLRIGRRLDARLAALRVRIVGIAGRDYAVGSPMSPEVRAALPRATIAIQEQVERALNS